MVLDERKKQILYAAVQEYILTAEPVSSAKLVAKSHGRRISLLRGQPGESTFPFRERDEGDRPPVLSAEQGDGGPYEGNLAAALQDH